MGGGTRSTRISYVAHKSPSQSSLSQYESAALSGAKKRAFISFHMDDEAQVDLLRHQAKNDRFDLEFTDYSVKEPFDEKWKTQCTERIRNSSVIIVMIGEETHTRQAVLWEINKAYELGKPVVGVRIYSNADHNIPEQMVQNNAKIVNWKMSEIQAAIDGAKA